MGKYNQKAADLQHCEKVLTKYWFFFAFLSHLNHIIQFKQHLILHEDDMNKYKMHF